MTKGTPTKRVNDYRNSRGRLVAEIFQLFLRSLDVLVHSLERWKQELGDLVSKFYPAERSPFGAVEYIGLVLLLCRGCEGAPT